MSVATITLNPAIDMTVRADNFQKNEVNRSQAVQYDPGGKGINVASILSDYRIDTTVTGFLGSKNAAIFESFFEKKKIEDRFVRLNGRTRTNIKIVDEAQQETTDINTVGFHPSEADTVQLFSTVEAIQETCNLFLIAGNLPPVSSTKIYAQLIKRLKENGNYVLLDSSREGLLYGVEAVPHVIKPNLAELEQISGKPLPTYQDIKIAVKELLEKGIELIVVSLGADGALFFSQKESFYVTPPRVQVKSTVGAGDAMVAGLIAGHLQQKSLAETARLATAFAAGAITQIGSHLPSAEVLETYIHQVSVRSSEDLTVLSGI